jgi:addiction module HigA family antidote
MLRLWTIIEDHMTKKLSPIPPGEILLEEFMAPLELSQNKLARDLDVPVGRINDILKARRTITTDTALRLGIYFGTSPEFWLNLQIRYDLKLAKKTLLPKIERGIRPCEKKVA